ncbi:diguanylate cyclase domain-containing protein [Alkalihalobacillus sp. NPDC078783]
MHELRDYFQSNEFTSLWDELVPVEEEQLMGAESFIYMIWTDSGLVSAKQMGPSSDELNRAFLSYCQHDAGAGSEEYIYIESNRLFQVANHPPIKFGVMSRDELCERDKLSILLQRLEQKLFASVCTFHAEGLLKEANYEITFRALINALFNEQSMRSLPFQFTLFEWTEEQLKHARGENVFPAKVLNEAKQNVHKQLVAKGHASCTMVDSDSQSDYMVLPIIFKERCLGCLVSEIPKQRQEWGAIFQNMAIWLQPLLEKGYQVEHEEREAKKKDLLLEVTKKVHSTMNISEVLAKIVYAIKQTYPTFDVYLMLSHEWEVQEELPIKPFIYGSEGVHLKAEQAFLTGENQVERNHNQQIVDVYMPLRGKQGIYGVLEIHASSLLPLPETEISFIEILADTGGNALENAELYQQSRDLIHDLKLINRAAHQINSKLNLNDLTESMTQQIKDAFGAQEVGFMLFDRTDQSVIHQSGTPYLQSNRDHLDLHTIIEQLLNKKDPIYIGDTGLHPDIKSGPFSSLLAIPMVHKEAVHGAVFAFHQESYHFTFESFKLLQSLVHHSTLAFTNTLLHEELEKLVITDHLTSLHSRNYLEESMEESLLEHEKGTFLLIDIDDFKRINDSFGHQIGDEILKQVASVIQSNIRETDIAARWGGEELAIYLPKVDLRVGTDIAKRIVKAVALHTSPPVTVSCGVSHWDKSESLYRSSECLFKSADTGLYKAKDEGKNRVMIEQPRAAES